MPTATTNDTALRAELRRQCAAIAADLAKPHRVEIFGAGGRRTTAMLPPAALRFPRGPIGARAAGPVFFAPASSDKQPTIAELHAEAERQRQRAADLEDQIAKLRAKIAEQDRRRVLNANAMQRQYARELHAMKATALRALPAHEARARILAERPIQADEIARFAREAGCTALEAFERLQADRAFAAGMTPRSFAEPWTQDAAS